MTQTLPPCPAHPVTLRPCGQRRRDWVAALGLVGLAGLAGCGSLVGPQVITLGQADLDRLLSRRFPMQRRVLDWLDLALSAPRLQLLPERNRMAVQLDLASSSRMAGWAGRARLDFDTALRYEARDATVRLTQVRVQQLLLDGGSGAPVPPAPAPAPAAATGGPLARLGQALAETTLDDLALYTVPTDRLAELRRLGLAPGAVTITARGVEITLARAA